MVDALRITDRRRARPGPDGVALRARANNQYVTRRRGAADRERGHRRRLRSSSTSSTSAAATSRCGRGSTACTSARRTPAPTRSIANRAAVGAWETFARVNNSDGTISLRATVNNRYVVAENGGAAALIANRTAIGPWEKFSLVAS